MRSFYSPKRIDALEQRLQATLEDVARLEGEVAGLVGCVAEQRGMIRALTDEVRRLVERRDDDDESLLMDDRPGMIYQQTYKTLAEAIEAANREPITDDE